MRLLRSLTLFLASLLSTGIHAQATIGSGIPPISGALLDLKEEQTNDGSANSKRGLVFPKVELHNLNPDSPSELAASIGSTGSWVLSEHTALAVYNVKEDLCATDPIYQGLYVFDGGKWQYLGTASGSGSTNVYHYNDTRTQLLGSQIYPYRTFGTAGDWMLENIRYVPNDGGATMTESLGDASYTTKYYAYPNTATIGTVPTSWRSSQGLLYTYSAATLGVQDGVNTDQGQGSAVTPAIQGVCPPGWHIPSDEEWNQLKAEIYNHADNYSSYIAADLPFTATYDALGTLSGWQADWESGHTDNTPPTVIGGVSNRGSTTSDGHSLAIQSICNVPGVIWDTDGKSLPTAQGGFNVLLTGYAEDGWMYSFSSSSDFWSASGNGSNNAWYRFVGRRNPQVGRFNSYRYSMFSVRCKK